MKHFLKLIFMEKKKKRMNFFNKFSRADVIRKGQNEREKKNKTKWSHEHAWLKPERDISSFLREREREIK